MPDLFPDQETFNRWTTIRELLAHNLDNYIQFEIYTKLNKEVGTPISERDFLTLIEADQNVELENGTTIKRSQQILEHLLAKFRQTKRETLERLLLSPKNQRLLNEFNQKNARELFDLENPACLNTIKDALNDPDATSDELYYQIFQYLYRNNPKPNHQNDNDFFDGFGNSLDKIFGFFTSAFQAYQQLSNGISKPVNTFVQSQLGHLNPTAPLSGPEIAEANKNAKLQRLVKLYKNYAILLPAEHYANFNNIARQALHENNPIKQNAKFTMLLSKVAQDLLKHGHKKEALDIYLQGLQGKPTDLQGIIGKAKPYLKKLSFLKRSSDMDTLINQEFSNAKAFLAEQSNKANLQERLDKIDRNISGSISNVNLLDRLQSATAKFDEDNYSGATEAKRKLLNRMGKLQQDLIALEQVQREQAEHGLLLTDTEKAAQEQEVVALKASLSMRAQKLIFSDNHGNGNKCRDVLDTEHHKQKTAAAENISEIERELSTAQAAVQASCSFLEQEYQRNPGNPEWAAQVAHFKRIQKKLEEDRAHIDTLITTKLKKDGEILATKQAKEAMKKVQDLTAQFKQEAYEFNQPTPKRQGRQGTPSMPPQLQQMMQQMMPQSLPGGPSP